MDIRTHLDGRNRLRMVTMFPPGHVIVVDGVDWLKVTHQRWEQVTDAAVVMSDATMARLLTDD